VTKEHYFIAFLLLYCFNSKRMAGEVHLRNSFWICFIS